MRYFLATLFMMSLIATSVSAQTSSDGFLIRVFGGTDIVAPTTPTLSAAAVATSQIDVSWSAATDNFLVSGYVIYRGGVPLATTSLTSYSDTGLSASTSYAYYVRAFDPSFNYSSSSNIASSTTFAPAPPAGSGTSGGTSARVTLDELRVTVGVSTSTFYIKTARPARFELRWGRTTSYELGYVVNDRFVSEYETTITDLEPGTTYEYEIVGYTPFGKATVLEKGQFKTLGPDDFFAPANVNRFLALPTGKDVSLSWQLPDIGAGSYVRIVRSHLGFPAHLQDGAIVYQGKGGSVVDTDILSQYSPVYYTAFVVDASGNFSSGAVAKVYIVEGDNEDGRGVVVPVVPDDGGVPSVTEDEGSASTSPQLPAGSRMPDLSEIFILQDGVRLSLADKQITLYSQQPFLLFIPKEAVSENLKTIIVTLTDPTDARKASAFILRLNKDKTAYEAVIAPLGLEGRSRIIIDIYDYSSAVRGTFQKTVTFKAKEDLTVTGFVKSELVLVSLVALPFLALAFWFLLAWRRRHR